MTRDCFQSWKWASNPPSPHQLEVVLTLQALADYFEGRGEDSRVRFRALRQRATLRGNALHEAWGLYGEAEAGLLDSGFDELLALLEKAERILAGLSDRQSLQICLGLRAQLHMNAGDETGALDSARRGVSALAGLAVNNFSTLEGFAGPAEVLWRIAAKDGANQAGTVSLAGTALRHLKRFARVHPIALPRLYLCRGLKAASRGRWDEARNLYLEGLRRSSGFNMNFEQRRLRRALETTNI